MALLDEVVAAHGGRARWEAAEAIVLQIRSGGFLMLSKVHRPSIPEFELRASTAEPHVVIRPYPRPGLVGVFDGTADAVRIETEDGHVAAERRHPRPAFRSLRHLVHWDRLDLLYFAGYALWGYATQPFCFLRPGVEAWELPASEASGERRRRVRPRARSGRPRPGPLLVWIDVVSARVEPRVS